MSTMSRQKQESSTLTSYRSEVEKRMHDMACAVLSEFRLEGKLCDVVIKVGDIEFNAHKIILCSCSPYFCTLFTGAWSTSNKQRHTIPGVLPEMMQLIINYAYTHYVPVTEDNVGQILEAGDQFLVQGMVQACCLFLEEQLSLKNCIGIWRLADFYHCRELTHKVFFYILHNFNEIVFASNELLELTVEQLTVIIENDHLNLKKEHLVFEAIVQWINHLPDKRRGHMSVLLHKVRLGLIIPSYLKYTVMTNEFVKDQPECMLIVTKAGNQVLRPTYPLYKNLMTRPRLPSAILLITGGKFFNASATNLEAYDARANSWVSLSADITRAYHGTVVLNNFVYIIGGCNLTTQLKTVERFDIVTGTWHRMANMCFKRCYVTVAVLNGLIYAMGGFNGYTYTNSVEYYTPETNKWTMMKCMRTRRCAAGATGMQGKLYICGGYNGHYNISMAERLNPNTNMWSLITPMSICRSGLGVVTHNDHIYAVGGTSSQISYLPNVEVYSPQSNMWTHLQPLHTPRSHFGIGVLENQLLVVGGFNGFTTLSSVECYSENTRTWSRASNINMARSGLGCCVLEGFQHVAEKLFSRGDLTPPPAEEEDAQS